MDFFWKKLLYKMLVKYYLSDKIKAPFENFALGLRNIWPDLGYFGTALMIPKFQLIPKL